MLELVSAGLAAWRIAHAVMFENGPFRVFYQIRKRFGIVHDEDGTPAAWPVNHILSCLWCFSFWTALVTVLVFPPIINMILAVNAIAIIIHDGLNRLNHNG